MKTHLLEAVHHGGNIDTEDRVLMSLDAPSLPHIQSILTNIYSDKELAPIREYSTNALDSHREAGISDPISVTLPNSFNPTFVVKDHGQGMSEAQVREEFSKYGWSSKRETDAAVGYLGIGCKSALTYTAQFTMTCIKDGKKVVVLITKDERGCGAIDIVGRFDTDEPNGVEVQVPVSNVRTFNQKARDFFWFWKAGDVEINGEPLTDCWDDDESSGLIVSDDVIMHTGLDRDYIVMGNVAYSVDRRLTDYDFGNYCAAVRVPIGAVDFTPSREALHYTSRTEKAVANARTFIEENVAAKAQAEVDAAETHAEAFDISKTWRDMLPRVNFTYKGEEVPRSFDNPNGILTWSDQGIFEGRYYAAKWVNTVQLEQLRRSIHVTGFTNKALTGRIKQAINRWRTENQISTRSIVLTSDPIGRPWVGDVHEVAWDELKKLAFIGPTHKTERFKVLRPNGKTTIVSTLKGALNSSSTTRNGKGTNKGRVVWVESGWAKDNRQHLAQSIGKGVLVVLVDGKSVKRWKREHPEILHVRQYAALRAARVTHQMTSNDSWRIDNAYEWNNSTLAKLDPDLIDDPEVAELLRTVPVVDHHKDDLGERYEAAVRLCNVVNIDGPSRPPASDVSDRVNAIQKKYPLLDLVDSYDLKYRDGVKQGIHDYVNALYIARQHGYVDNQAQGEIR